MKIKNINHTIVRVFLVIFIIVTSFTISGTGLGSNHISIDEAFLIAEDHIQRASKTIPDWKDAEPILPKTHYDLDSSISAYVFTVVKNGVNVGYITISSQHQANPVLEFSTAPGRHLSTLTDIRAFAQDLDMTIDEQKPLYLGLLAYFYRIENEKNTQIVEMGSQRIISLSNRSSQMHQQRSEVHQVSDNTLPDTQYIDEIVYENNIQSTVLKLLYGPDYQWYRGCGPTATANAMGHWADRGYPNLVYGGSEGDYQGTIDQLADIMGTSSQGWTYLPIDDDIKEFTRARNYSFNSDEYTNPSYSKYVGEINAHRPIVVLVNDHDLYGDHFITGFGYEYDPENSSYRYMIVHDTWGSTPEDYWVQYGTGYNKIWFDTVIPPQMWIDSTHPSSSVIPLPAYHTTTSFDVMWSGNDNPGGWGIQWFDIQYKDGDEGEWVDWLTQTDQTDQTFQGDRGHAYYFRSRSMDIDHNQEEYPIGDGDSHTTIAKHVIEGEVTGNRGLPVITAKIYTSPESLGPATTAPFGTYKAGVNDSGVYSLSILANSPFGTLPSMKDVQVFNDVKGIDFVLLPADDLINNGGFESGALDNWTISGIVSPTITAEAHTGEFSVSLGQNPPIGGGSSTISQSVYISPTIELATFSFLFKNDSPDSGVGEFLIKVNSTTSSDTYNLYELPSTWQHAWFDLSDFIGQTVEIILEVIQDSNEDPMVITVDEISLGSAAEDPKWSFLPIISKP